MKRASLLLLPGLDGTGILLTPLLRALGAEWDVKVLSYPQDPKLGYQDYLDLVRAALPEADFFILGESFSGPIALKIAAEHPKGLRGVILCATFVKNPAPLFPAFLRFLVVAPLFLLCPFSFRLNVLTTFRNTEELRLLMKRVVRVTNNRVLAARTREAIGVNVEGEFAACSYPLLYLCGARDMVVTGRNHRSMRRLRPDMQVERLDTSHLVLQEAPDEAATHVRAFMSGHLPGNRPL
ncbi:MAG: alpha/beta hydrolase [Planctomycetota bacterium]